MADSGDRREEETHMRCLVQRYQGSKAESVEDDWLAAEVPLEIRIEGRSVAVVMRTPGADLDLVAGFLYTEGVIDGEDDLHAMAHVDDPLDPQGNTVDVVLASGVPAARRSMADRNLFASSSCGVCGKASIDRVFLHAPPLGRTEMPSPEVLHSLTGKMREGQAVFERTGGLHAAAVFGMDGALEVLREDIGRHNAVDKVVGSLLRKGRAPLGGRILAVSGRAGFEIVQKALMARIPVVASVGAPSGLAAELAIASNIHLAGFLRDGRFNLYVAP
jgi:FdhD protein